MKRDEIYQALKQLGELHQQGILSDEEFQEEKKTLMAMLRGTSSVSSPPPTPAPEPPTTGNQFLAAVEGPADAADIFATGGGMDSTPTPSFTAQPIHIPAPTTQAEPADAIDIFATGGGAPPSAPAPSATPVTTQATQEVVEAVDIFSTGGGVPPEAAPQPHVVVEQPPSDGADFFATGGDAPPAPDVPTQTTPAEGPLLAERYRVLEELGRGGMGTVLRAHDTETQKDVAIKTLHQTGNVSEMRRRFLQELTLHERLAHHNIVGVKTLEKDKDLGFFFTMEFVKGQTLDARLKDAKSRQLQPPLSHQETMDVLEQLASGLDHAHEKGVLHLDLKPANILLVDQVVKIIDFGIARLRSKGAGQQIMGTVYYMAPEQLSGEGELGAPADIYALGIITYQLLTGKIFQGGMPGPSHFHEGLPQDVDDVHAKAVSYDPSQRFQTAGKFVSALRKALRAAPSQDTTLAHEGRKASTKTIIKKVYIKPKDKRRDELVVTQAGSDEPLRYWPKIRDNSDRKRPRWLDTPVTRKPPKWLAARELTDEQRQLLPVTPLIESMILLSKEGLPLLELCKIPGGTFTLGADKRDKKARRQEKPQTQVTLSTFWLARTMVTQAMWKCFLNESRYEPEGDEAHPQYLAHWRNEAPVEGSEEHPITNVSMLHVWAFCDFYGLSLPSEAQWEAAARGTDGALYPWGNTPPGQADTDAPLAQIGYNRVLTAPVSAHQQGASPYGLLDCMGNAQQWVADEYDTRWLRQLRDKDPVIQGEDRARFYSLRGCPSTIEPDNARVYRRDSEHADRCTPLVSFRPCLDLDR
ncbi:MAG TPA: hypothetical protein DCE42_17480 [Myxococcales bacterium]|nr:hypothetical protein [Myxococcales bacterium]